MLRPLTKPRLKIPQPLKKKKNPKTPQHLSQIPRFRTNEKITKSKRRKCTFSLHILHFFHFGPYILFLPLLVPKPINTGYLSP